ncbi:MAG: helix-turn-helix domain-containing protein [Cytophagaceae bacterium]
MKHLTILIPNGEGNNLSSIVGSYKIFSRAEAYWARSGKAPLFKIELVGTATSVDYYDGLFSVKPHTTISSIAKTDVVIIPSLNHQYQQAIRDNKELIPWIEKQYKSGAEIASICTGAFLLANTGLLNGLSCSTHWSAANDFRNLFTQVHLLPDKLITDEKGIYTNGGAYSFLNLIIYLIEKYYNRETAIFCSKVFQIDMERSSQSGFMIFNGQKQHEDDAILKAQQYIEEHVQDKISVDELSSTCAVSRRNFDRRFMKATGNSPVEYIQRVKMEAAKKGFEAGRKNIHEIMYEVGYSDPKAFREVFRKITGMSPLAYKSRYSKGV